MAVVVVGSGCCSGGDESCEPVLESCGVHYEDSKSVIKERKVPNNVRKNNRKLQN